MTTCHLHLMGNQWHVSPGEHPSSDILNSPNENLTDPWNLRDREKIYNNFDALKPGQRPHYIPYKSYHLPQTYFEFSLTL